MTSKRPSETEKPHTLKKRKIEISNEKVNDSADKKILKKKPSEISKENKGSGHNYDNVKGRKNAKKAPTDAKIKSAKGFHKNKISNKASVSSSGDKPVWSEMKKQKKELRIQRKKSKTSVQLFEISHKAKMLATQIQRKSTTQAVRENLCLELHNVLKTQYKSLALSHDLSRVIQVMLKHSVESMRADITEELIPIVVLMAQSKYAHHCVKRILKYSSDNVRSRVIDKLMGSILTLASHVVSAPILDTAYAEHATSKQKTMMQQEFYGDIYKNNEDPKVSCLSDAYRDSPEMKEATLSACKANILHILNKNLHDSELFHTVLHQYLSECGADDRAELVATLSPLIVPLSNSLPGVKAACMCVWLGTNKDKKTILKVVKEHAVPLSTHKTGYRLLIAIFDSVDDTVLVKKTIISVLEKNIREVAKSHWGKMTLHWLVKPADAAAFHPTFTRQLREGGAAGSSKKDPETRAAELRTAILPALCEDIKSDPKFWMADPTMALLAVTVLTSGVPQLVMSSITNVICQPDWQMTVEGKTVFGIEDAGMHLCIKKLIQKDKDSEVTFGAALAEEITDETLNIWLKTNRGCFVLLKAIENNAKPVVKEIVKKLKPFSELLETQTSQGAKLLLKHLV